MSMVAAAAVMLGSTGEAHSAAAAMHQRIDDLVASYMPPERQGTGTVPKALSLALIRRGAPLWLKGYGQATPESAATGDTLYRIGSIAKQFTAAAVLKALEQGARTPGGAPVTLDSNVDEIIDGVAHWRSEDKPPITLRRLLNMTSSLPNFTARPPLEADPWGAIAASKLLGQVRRYVPNGNGVTFEYSNTAYFLLAQCLEEFRFPSAATAASGSATGKPPAVDLRQRLFSDAGLHATFLVGDELSGVLAVPEYRRRPAFREPDWLKGSGDIISTARDLQAWLVGLFGGRVLSQASLAEMLADGGRVGPREWYGMGWFIERREEADLFTHTGTLPGYTSFLAVRRSKTKPSYWNAVVLLTNGDRLEGLDDLGRTILDEID